MTHGVVKAKLTDKLDTCSLMLEDTFVGFFSGHAPQTTTHLTYAVLTIVRDLKRFYEKERDLDLGFRRSVEFDDKKKADTYIGRKPRLIGGAFNMNASSKAAYTKHADQEPLATELFSEMDDIMYLTFAYRDLQKLIMALAEQDLLQPSLSSTKFFELRVWKLGGLFTDFSSQFLDHLRTIQNGSNPPEEAADITADVMSQLKRQGYDEIVSQELFTRQPEEQILMRTTLLQQRCKCCAKPDVSLALVV